MNALNTAVKFFEGGFDQQAEKALDRLQGPARTGDPAAAIGAAAH